MSDVIFQSSDLANKRTEVLEAARNGQARVRDKDGTSLVMLPESRLRLLETLTKWWQAYMKLEALLHRSELPRAGELGELAWLCVFDRADFQEFVSELHDAQSLRATTRTQRSSTSASRRGVSQRVSLRIR